MTTSEQEQPQAINTDSISEETYKHYVSVNPGAKDMLSFSDWATREQVKLLRGINDKLNFFVFLIVLSMIIYFLLAVTSLR